MADVLQYALTYAGVPFVLDRSAIVRMTPEESPVAGRIDPAELPPRKYQPEANLIEEINRLLPFAHLENFLPVSPYPGRNLGAIAMNVPSTNKPDSEIKIGDWWYPPGASRWSVFRYLATDSMVNDMLIVTNGRNPGLLSMSSVPVGALFGPATSFTVATEMFLLDARTITKTKSDLDGLILCTFIDDRFFFQGTPSTVRPTPGATWNSIAQEIASQLGITLTVPDIPAVYSVPEPDSQFWANVESSPALLDAIALNVGMVVVRNLDGTYQFMTAQTSLTTVQTNRFNVSSPTNLVRIAGSDIWNSGQDPSFLTGFDSIVPANIHVSFPQYVIGNDPVPHFVNPRYANQRDSCWYEESHGQVYKVQVPVASGGAQVIPALSGGQFTGGRLDGVSDYFLHDTAKALYSGEAQATSGGAPLNQSGLTALAVQIAVDRYNWLASVSLDERYPGTFAWTPEGIHDIVWTYSADSRIAACRVMRPAWNAGPVEMQHAAHAMSGQTIVPPGVGGPSVPQSWRDTLTAKLGSTTLTGAPMTASDTQVVFNAADYFPTQNRWKGIIQSGQNDQEICLFEGTSGGTTVGIAQRGIDWSIQQAHVGGASVIHMQPNTQFGTNLVSSEKMQWLFPGAQKSGGIAEVVVVPQTQTIHIFDASGDPTTLNNITSYSGQVGTYDPSKASGQQWVGKEFVWVQERTGFAVTSGAYRDGQLVAPGSLNKAGKTFPIYAIDEYPRVQQNTRDQYSIAFGGGGPTLNGSILSGDTSYAITNGDYLPTENRWLALIDSELMLMDGTSGLLTGLTVAKRGFNNTAGASHANGASVTWQKPDAQSGMNLTTFDKGFFAFYGAISGNMETVVRCPLRTVHVLDGSGVSLNGYRHFSGKVNDYDPSANPNPYTDTDPIWVVERNNFYPSSGLYYDGQLVAFSVSGGRAPVYAINVFSSGDASSTSGASSTDIKIGFNYTAGTPYSGAIGGGTSGKITFGTLVTDTHSFHSNTSGTIFKFNSGGIGSYHLHAKADWNTTFSGTITTSPLEVVFMAATSGGAAIKGADDCAWFFRLVYSPDPLGTGTNTMDYEAACLEFGRDIEITNLNDIVELWGQDTTGTSGQITNCSICCHKVNRAASVASG